MPPMQWIQRLQRKALGRVRDSVALGWSVDPLSRFRRDFGKHFERRYVLPLNSGTSANEAAVFGLGLQPEDEVICPAAAPIFVSMPVLAAGAIPVFADVDPRTLLLRAEDIERRINPRTRAVMVVHQYGQAAPMGEILSVAEKHGLKVVEDCAQAYDSHYCGKRVGTFGDVMCSSLQQSKHITSGEGGLVATNDPEIYKRALLYSNAGMPFCGYGMDSPEPEIIDSFKTRGHWSFGHNHRMSIYQAAIACSQLRRIRSVNKRRIDNVAAIEDELRDCPAIELAHRHEDTSVNYWQYPLRLNPEKVRVSARDVTTRVLERMPRAPISPHDEINYLEHVFQGIERSRRGPHGQNIPEGVSYKRGLCPIAEQAVRRFFCISVHSDIPSTVMRQTAKVLREVVMELQGS